MNDARTNEKRVRHLALGVALCTVQTYWNDSALIFEDNSGEGASRKVTLRIATPNDLSYIRERLQNIEDAWRRALDQAKYP